MYFTNRICDKEYCRQQLLAASYSSANTSLHLMTFPIRICKRCVCINKSNKENTTTKSVLGDEEIKQKIYYSPAFLIFSFCSLVPYPRSGSKDTFEAGPAPPFVTCLLFIVCFSFDMLNFELHAN